MRGKPTRRRAAARAQPGRLGAMLDRPLVPAFLARGSHGAVVAPHHLATAAGLSILRAGGSAVDAAIATNAVLAVVDNEACGIGGDAFWLIWDASSGAPARPERQRALRPDRQRGGPPGQGSPGDAPSGRPVDHGSRRRPVLGRCPRPVRAARSRQPAGPGDRDGPGRLPGRRGVRPGGRGERIGLRARARSGSRRLELDLPAGRPALAARRAGPPAGPGRNPRADRHRGLGGALRGRRWPSARRRPWRPPARRSGRPTWASIARPGPSRSRPTTGASR